MLGAKYEVIVERKKRWRVEVSARSEEEAKKRALALLSEEDGMDLDPVATIPELLEDTETATARPKK